MKENFIIIEKVTVDVLESILIELGELYADTGYTEGIQLYQKKEDSKSFLVLFSNQPDFERFNYFINYIRYPEGQENYEPFIRGFYRTSEIPEKAAYKVGEWIMIYLPENDTEFDNVHIVNHLNENFKLDFGGKTIKLDKSEQNFKMIFVDIHNFSHVIDIIPEKAAEKMVVKPWWKFW